MIPARGDRPASPPRDMLIPDVISESDREQSRRSRVVRRTLDAAHHETLLRQVQAAVAAEG
jgi:hypothetical protein